MSQDLLQSDGWERFQRALGRRTHRVDGVLAIEMPLPFGGVYLYSPRSPLPPRHCEEGRWPSARRGNLTPSIQTIAKETSAIFWRTEFSQELGGRGAAGTRQLEYSSTAPRVLRRAVEPEWTWRTSLTESDDERLAAMRPKHRYNIGLARRQGVIVWVSTPPPAPPQHEGEGQPRSPTSYRGGARGGAMPEDLDVCWSLLQDTAQRQGIQTHPRTYYETMLATLAKFKIQNSKFKTEDTDCLLYIAERTGEPLAAAIVAYHGDTATYLHGGSSYEHRALMAPHLLHWQAMRDAKAAGMRWYDWGGIRPEMQNAECRMQNADWLGMTRFKMGFGGEAVHHPPTRDLVFRSGWYRVLSWMAMMRP